MWAEVDGDKLILFVYVLKRKNHYFGKRVMEMSLPYKGKKWRPKRRFMDAVKVNLKVVEILEENAMDQ